MLVKLKNTRMAFPQLFEARSVNGEGEPAFSAAFIFAKDHPSYKEMETAIMQVAKEKWGEKATAVLKELKARDKTALHDGDLKSDYDGYEGNFYVSARSKKRPLVIDGNKSVLTAADGKPYGGCFVNANVDLWAQDNQFGKRINATLVGVQMYKDGEAFSGGAPADPEDFDTVEEDDEDLV